MGKHKRTEDDEVERHGKRVKLDAMLRNLSLEDVEEEEDPEFIINPQVPTFNYDTEPPKPPMDKYLAEQFNAATRERFQVVKRMLPLALVAYRFQRWCLRMFNKFIQQYNVRHNSGVRRLRTYEQMILLARENEVSAADFWTIIMKENAMELLRLANKKRNDLRVAFTNMGYNYWDTVRLDKDIDMWDRVEELTPTNSDMDLDEDESPIVANYGTYYTDDPHTDD